MPPLKCTSLLHKPLLPRLSLNGAWEVTNANGSIVIQGNVPGEVHTDLMRAGMLGDPHYRYNDFVFALGCVFISRFEWVGRDTWTYSRTFTVDYDLTDKVTWIHCDGIDTVAEIL